MDSTFPTMAFPTTLIMNSVETTFSVYDIKIGLSTDTYNARSDGIIPNNTVLPSSLWPIQNNINPPSSWRSSHVQIPLYAIIFLLSVVGNALVILTLVQNKRMRTVTNVFLLNLAASDLLLGVFCMPFTLVGTLLREFIFGEAMCRLIPYVQAVSVTVSAWTLVSISVERYFAICQPLRSRRWQTRHHAYKMIAAVWVGSAACMIPIAVLSELQPIRDTGKYKCREAWPERSVERAFNMLLDLVLLVIPLVSMIITYALITATLWKGMKAETTSNKNGDHPTLENSPSDCCGIDESNGRAGKMLLGSNSIVNNCSSDVQGDSPSLRAKSNSPSKNSKNHLKGTLPTKFRRNNSGLRRSNVSKSLSNKNRVIKMLFVVVLEFFICWTPLYVINTISLFNPRAVYGGLGYTGISFCQLLAYGSSCCNPITYCFMNSTFRNAFISAFGCTRRTKKKSWDCGSSYRSSKSCTTLKSPNSSCFYMFSVWLKRPSVTIPTLNQV